MSFAKFGVGLQALTQGALNGLQIRDSLDARSEANERKQAAKEGIQIASDNQTKNIADQIKLGGLDATGNQTYQVGGQSYSDIGSAQKAAKNAAPDFFETYNKVAAPRMRDVLLKQGNPEGAMQWDNWIQNNNTQAGLKHWTQAVTSAQNGDMNGAANSLVKAYNTNGYFDDGTTVSNVAVTKDDKGNTSGINFEFKGPDGKTMKRSFNNVDDFIHQGVALLAPEQAFKYSLSKADSHDAAVAATQGKVLESNLKTDSEIKVEQAKHKNKIEEIKTEDVGKMERTKVAANRLRAAGGADDLSPTGKTIRDLQAVGVPKEKAIALATDSKSNPAAQRLQIYNSIVTATKAAGEDLPSDADMAKRVDSAYKLINQLKDPVDTGADPSVDSSGEDFSHLWN